MESDEEEPSYPTIPRRAGRESVMKAIELVKTKQSKMRNKRSQKLIKQEEHDRLIEAHCSTDFTANNPNYDLTSTSFHNTYAKIEMHNALASNDWASLQRLFPFLLQTVYQDPIVWRYAFLIFLLSPATDRSHLTEFIEMCVGNDVTENGILLEQLFSLESKIE